MGAAVPGFLGFVVRGRTQAIVGAAGATLLSILCGLLSLWFWPLILLAVWFYFVSPAVVALTALRRGMAEAAVVAAGPAALWALPLLFGTGAEIPVSLVVAPFLYSVLGVFVPVILLSGVLRATHSQALMLTAGAALVGALVVALDLLGSDPMAWMLEQLTSASDRMAPGPMGPGAAGTEPLSPRTQDLLQGMWAASTLFSLVMTVYLARWWHSVVDNPGGFGQEFRAIRLDRRLSFLFVALLVVAQLVPYASLAGLALKLLLVVAVLYTFQGLAIAHSLVRGRRSPRAWLTALYVLLVLSKGVYNLPLILVVGAGLLDPWLDFRRRWAHGT